MKYICHSLLMILVGLGMAATAQAQYSLTATPYISGGHSFYENYNIGWGLQGRGFAFNWNGGNAVPPFGNFDPNAQAQFGGAFKAGPHSGGFRITAGQGADTSLVSQTPSVTVMNGGTGYFSDTTQRPFVTSFVPVLGSSYFTPPPIAGSYYHSPLQERIARLKAQGRSSGERSTEAAPTGLHFGAGAPGPSSAEQGTASVAVIKAGHAGEEAAKLKEIADLLAKADALAAEGKNAVARIFYQQAARRADEEQRAEIAARIRRLE